MTMTEQQKHLQSAVEQQNSILDEINQLNSSLNIKKEQAIKLQGVIEYLTQIGVTLPQSEESSESPEFTEETKEV